MRGDETGKDIDKVRLHYKTEHSGQALTLIRSIQTASLSGRKIQTIDLSPLSSCSSLQALDLSNNQLQSINLSPLSSCSSLQTLYLGGNQLQSTDFVPLSSCKDLRALGFSRNHLQRIDLSPLSSCSNLLALHLQNNQLQRIDLAPLSSCGRLQTVDLSGNRLRSIDLTPLSSCSRLQELYVDYNQLQSIDLTPLLCCTKLERLDLRYNRLLSIMCALNRETLQLVASRLLKSMRPRVRTADGHVPSRTDLAVLSRVVDTLWHGPDASERWRAHAVVQDVLGGLGFGWLGLLDVEPPAAMAVVNGIREGGQLTDDIIRLLCQQIDRGGTAIGLDVERMVEHGELALKVQRLLEMRGAEMEQVSVVFMTDDTCNTDGFPPEVIVDLRSLWLTAYGRGILVSMRLHTSCTEMQFREVSKALSVLGFRLKVTTDRRISFYANISEPLRQYIWKLADSRP